MVSGYSGSTKYDESIPRHVGSAYLYVVILLLPQDANSTAMINDKATSCIDFFMSVLSQPLQVCFCNHFFNIISYMDAFQFLI